MEKEKKFGYYGNTVQAGTPMTVKKGALKILILRVFIFLVSIN